MKRRLLIATTALTFLAAPLEAHAAPVAAAAAAFSAWLASASVAATIATFVIRTAVTIAVSAAAQKLLGPKSAAGTQERQAAVLSLTLGESPREAIFGRAAVGGTLLDTFNYGGANGTDWEVRVVKVADHKCDALEGFWVDDTYYAFSGDGAQSGFNGQLEVYWKNGDPAQTASSFLTSVSAGRLQGTPWTSSDVFASMAAVIFAYKADAPNASNPVWPQGRPKFLSLVRGKLCYDPRKDTTAGGSGAHRWATPSTWEWTENARVCDYNYDRGIYALDQVSDPKQLLIGRGLSAVEAPPDRVFAAANVCDEDVPLKAGGTEKRYRVGGVVYASETFGSVKERFAAAMAGTIVKRNGGVEIEPGAAKSTVAEITDDDLVVGETITSEKFLSDNDRVNTVVPRYIAPDQLWRDHGAPVRRSTADITADGGLKTEDLAVDLVTSGTQAQRCGEIKRRLNRKERRAALVLGPKFAHLEDGDWVGYTSARRFGGSRVVFRLDAAGVRADYRVPLVLRQIGSDCYDWVAASDEGTPGQAPVDELGSVAALALSGVAFTAYTLTGTDGTTQPAIKAVWTTPVDPAVKAVRMEVRRTGDTIVAFDRCDNPNAGQFVTTNGTVGGTSMEARLIPVTTDGRITTPSAWLTVNMASADLTAAVDIPSANLFRKQDYAPVGGASSIDPAFGVANWGFRMTSTAGQVTVAGKTYANLPQRYSVALRTKLVSGTGTAQIRVGWRDASNAAIADLADQIVTVTTQETRWSWDLFGSTDVDFTTAKFVILNIAGDIAGGKVVDVADVHVVNGGKAPEGFSPSPDDPEGLRLFGYTGAFDATRNTVTRSTSAPSSPIDGDIWVDTSTTPPREFHRVSGSWQLAATVGGTFGSNVYEDATTLAALAAFKTALGTAAFIAGQAPAATDSSIQAGATNNNVSFGTVAPSSPTDGDLWADTTNNPLVWKIRISGAWQTVSSLGAVYGSTVYETLSGALATLTNFKTSLGTAAFIANQAAWATEATLTPVVVGGRTQWFASDGKFYDYRGALYGFATTGVAGRTTQPLTSTSSSVSVAAHPVLFPLLSGGNFTLNVPSTSFSGLPADTTHTVFYRPDFNDWSCQGPATTPPYFTSRDGWMFVGQIRTAVSGTTYNPPPYGSGGAVDYCLDADAHLESGQRAGDAQVGDPLLMMNPAADGHHAGAIDRIVPAAAECLRFTTCMGAVLTVSDTAPIMTRRAAGEMPYPARASDCRPGVEVPLLNDGEVVWDRVATIEPVGLRNVVRISAGHGIFAASDAPGGLCIFTHNGYPKP